MKRILVAGEINVDLILGGCSRMPQPDTEVLAQSFDEVLGSSSVICAMGLARLGDPVKFVGYVGNDTRGAFCVNAMREAGIEVSAIRMRRDLATGVTISISTTDDHAAVTFAGCIDSLVAGDVDDALLAEARHLHVSSFYLQRKLRPQLSALFARARAAGLSTSLDPDFDPDERWSDAWPELLMCVDVFLPNRGEALAIAGCDDVEAALRKFRNGITRTVIKCGSEGTVTLDDAGNILSTAPMVLDAVRDTTGAGDSFNAGFLHAWLAKRPLEECLRWGNACGGLSTRGLGGTATQATVAEARAWVERAS